MKKGTQVSVTGAQCFSGTVLSVGDHILVIEVAAGVSTTLRRDIASTKPMQWRCAGLPVEVREKPDLEEFRRLLFALEKRTRNY